MLGRNVMADRGLMLEWLLRRSKNIQRLQRLRWHTSLSPYSDDPSGPRTG
jgi:hypothetical protein